ncbi:recombinase family protein [Halococcus sp. AFM35]|uniref:recombinase family protein n=1 Tax=Halococcus sp. AFM35 TaxID=3421653 RepID=UPI003EB6F845
MQIAAYVRVSTDDQNEQRQMRAIRAKYDDDQQDNQIEWYCDLGESGASTSRQEYQRLREHVAEYDVVVAHELDRLGRSFADLAGFVEDLREKGVDIDLVNQPIGTVGEDDWMAEMMLNMMMVFADAERKMIRSRVQEGIDAAIADGKRVGRPPFGYTVEDGFLQQIPSEYVRAQTFIREVRKGREKHATAAFFEIPDSAIQSILTRAETNYDVPFDNDQWQLERAKVDAGEKELPPLDVQEDQRTVSARSPRK